MGPFKKPPTKKAAAHGARAWQRMLSGRRLDLLDPSPLDIEMEDIAHGLARVARWNGQTSGTHIFSVAQHCLLVEALARARVPRLDRSRRLAVLLHDAPEYVIGDMITPFKAVIGDSYKAVEQRLRSEVDEDHFVGAREDGVGDRLAHADPAQLCDAVVERLEAAGFTNSRFSRIVPEKSCVSCVTNPIRSRRASRSISVLATPL